MLTFGRKDSKSPSRLWSVLHSKKTGQASGSGNTDSDMSSSVRKVWANLEPGLYTGRQIPNMETHQFPKGHSIVGSHTDGFYSAVGLTTQIPDLNHRAWRDRLPELVRSRIPKKPLPMRTLDTLVITGKEALPFDDGARNVDRTGTTKMVLSPDGHIRSAEFLFPLTGSVTRGRLPDEDVRAVVKLLASALPDAVPELPGNRVSSLLALILKNR
ncbi:MAG: hypothetical protein AB7P76_05775 [Candidatus Melainabacteria bacterium]